jgi:hypothetical protein
MTDPDQFIDSMTDSTTENSTTHCGDPFWQEDDLPLRPDQEQEQGLPFRGDTKMVGFAE